MVKKYIVLFKDMSITLDVIVEFSLLNLDFSFVYIWITDQISLNATVYDKADTEW